MDAVDGADVRYCGVRDPRSSETYGLSLQGDHWSRCENLDGMVDLWERLRAHKVEGKKEGDQKSE